MKPTIQSNIPCPPAHKGRTPLYPFGEMKPNDSFFHTEKKINMSGYQYAWRHGKFTIAIRRVTEKGKKGWRIWRLA